MLVLTMYIVPVCHHMRSEVDSGDDMPESFYPRIAFVPAQGWREKREGERERGREREREREKERERERGRVRERERERERERGREGERERENLCTCIYMYIYTYPTYSISFHTSPLLSTIPTYSIHRLLTFLQHYIQLYTPHMHIYVHTCTCIHVFNER